MNNRLYELMNQAFIGTTDGKLSELNTVANIKKFAELIVGECVQTLFDNTPERFTNEAAEEDWDKGYDRAMKDCIHHIQEHFGVKE